MIQVGESQNKKKDLRWFLGVDLDYNIHLHLLFFFRFGFVFFIIRY